MKVPGRPQLQNNTCILNLTYIFFNELQEQKEKQ